MSAELLIQNGSTLYSPVVLEGIEWSTERQGSPGKLTFKVLADGVLNISEGNAVRFKWNGANIFYGFIFTIKRDKENILTITAYDQLRYLKNKDTYVYENKTASEVVKMICDDFEMQTGTIENTGYRIASRVEDNQTLFDIIQNAIDATLTNSNQMYVLFDDFGKVTLRSINGMYVGIVLDESTGQNFDYTSSIDEQTYNKIKLFYDNEKTKQRDVYIVVDSNNINEWGVLQLSESIEEGENGQAKAEALLDLYNRKTKKLSVKDAFGDVRVRAGSMVAVVLDLGDMKLEKWMLVESCKHNFSLDEHTMTVSLKGGDFIA